MLFFIVSLVPSVVSVSNSLNSCSYKWAPWHGASGVLTPALGCLGSVNSESAPLLQPPARELHRRWWVMATVVGSMPLMWETGVGFLAASHIGK